MDNILKFDLKVGMYEKHEIQFIFDILTESTQISVDGTEIFRSRSLGEERSKTTSSNKHRTRQWFHSFIVGTQETHVIEIHLRFNEYKRKHKQSSIDINLIVDSVLEERMGKKLDPHKSITREDVVLEKMSRDFFHVLSDGEKKCYSRDILKDPQWRDNWVYIH